MSNTTFSAVNKVTNGNFTTDISGWTKNSGTNASRDTTYFRTQYSTASMKFTDSSDYSQSFTTINGHKYYCAVWGSETLAGGTMGVGFYSGAGTTINFNTHAGTWIHHSAIITSSSTSGSVVLSSIGTGYAYLDCIMMVDMTAAFGSGNEPTLAQMDAFVYANAGYWDGTLSFITNVDLINYTPGGNFEKDLSTWTFNISPVGYSYVSRVAFPITVNSITITSSDGYGSYLCHGMAMSTGSAATAYLTKAISFPNNHYVYMTTKGLQYVNGTGAGEVDLIVDKQGSGGYSIPSEYLASFPTASFSRVSAVGATGSTGVILYIKADSDADDDAEYAADGIITLDWMDFYDLAPVMYLGDLNISNLRDATDCMVNKLLADGGVWPSSPGVPTGVTATGGINKITVSWTAPADNGGSAITGYYIYRSVDGSSYSYLADAGLVTSYDNTGLLAGQTFYYKVEAYNAIGISSLSSGASATTATAPSPPTTVACTASNNGALPAIRIAWSGASGHGDTITNYKIYRAGSLYKTLSGSLSQYIDDNSGAGYSQAYTTTFTISAVGATLGEGNQSSPATSGTSGTVPDTITGMSAVATTSGGHPAIYLSWPSPLPNTDTGISSYKVYYLDVTGNYTLLTTLSSTTTHYTDDGSARTPPITLNENTLYYYKVSSTNAIGESALSNAFYGTTPSYPSVPRNVTLTIATPTSITVTWNAPSWTGGGLVNYYKVYWGQKDLDGTTDVTYPTFKANVAISGTTYTASGLSQGKIYTFGVSASSALGEGSTSAAVKIVLPGAPDAPSNFSARIVNGVYPVLSWSAPATNNGGSILYYTIRAGTSAAPSTIVCYPDTVSKEAIDINPVVVGSTIYYTITATNSVGESSTASTTVTVPSDGVDDKILSVGNLITNGSFDLDYGIDGWNYTAGSTITLPSAVSGMFYDKMVNVNNGVMYYDADVPAGHTVIVKTKAFRDAMTGNASLGLAAIGAGSFTNTTIISSTSPDWYYRTTTVKTTDTGYHDDTTVLSTGVRVGLISIGSGVTTNYDGVMLLDLTNIYGHGAVFTSNTSTGFNPLITELNNFVGGYWEGTFTLPKVINGVIMGRVKTKLTLRGQSTAPGRLAFYFKDNNGVELFEGKWWFTDNIAEGVNYDAVRVLISDASNIYTYNTLPEPYTDDPEPFPGPDYTSGWPKYVNTTTLQDIPLLYTDPILYEETDLLGSKLSIEMYTYPARFTYYSDNKYYHYWSEVSVNLSNDKGLEGYGTLMVTSDYTTYVRFNTLHQEQITTEYDATTDHYMSLNFLINSWFVGDNSLSTKEDLGKQAPYFRIPIYTGDTLYDIKNRIEYGDDGTLPDKPVVCDSLYEQINAYFNKVGVATGLMSQNSFHVVVNITPPETGVSDYYILSVRVFATNENVQQQISCYAYQTTDLYVSVKCNQYFINDNIFELRSYYDMYGIDKPKGNTASTEYKPLAYGFTFPLDIITDYNETESSQLDVTPIPGQSSAKAIGIDAVGALRDITINGIRVDNSNIWTFHVPWQEEGENRGIIYTGTSNWGWCKFLKAILGCFQMTSGPYRLVMMTVPSSSQMQYFPTRDGSYQYSDGTYVILAGWEDMCYVMVENFTYSRSEDMFNAIQYSLKLKRVTPLLSSSSS